MNGFGFIEYEDEMDAKDIVPGMASVQHSKASANIPQLSVRPHSWRTLRS
jgi:hypothetical protein